MVSTDPQAVAWNVELRSSGQVCVDVGRGRSAGYGLIGLLLGVIGGGLLAYGGIAAPVMGAILLVIAVPMVIWSVQLCLRVGAWRSPQVLVDAEGITVRHGYLRVPWADLYGAHAFTANHNRWVMLGLSPECYDAWVRSRSPLMRLLARRPGRRRIGMLQLPPNLAVDTEAFAAWLTDEVRTRQHAELEQARMGLNAAVQHVADEAERLAEQDLPQA
jgi:hypothetical protein